jgi:hypothetical protein
MGRKAVIVPGRRVESQAKSPDVIRSLTAGGSGPIDRIRVRSEALSIIGQAKGRIGTLRRCGS